MAADGVVEPVLEVCVAFPDTCADALFQQHGLAKNSQLATALSDDSVSEFPGRRDPRLHRHLGWRRLRLRLAVNSSEVRSGLGKIGGMDSGHACGDYAIQGFFRGVGKGDVDRGGWRVGRAE